MAPYRVGQRDLITMSSPNPCKPARDPSQQNRSLLEAEQDEEEHEEPGEAERREREFPARPGEECSEAYHCYSHHIKNNLRFCPMILFEFQFNLKLYFWTGYQLCARDLEFYFDMVKLHVNSAEQ